MSEKLTKEELQSRIDEALSEIAATLASYLPRDDYPVGERQVAYCRDQMLRQLVHVARGLRDGFTPWFVCEGCGKTIEPGAPYVNAGGEDDIVWLCHACSGEGEAVVDRRETREEEAVDLVKRIAAVEAYIDAGGCFADLPEDRAGRAALSSQEKTG